MLAQDLIANWNEQQMNKMNEQTKEQGWSSHTWMTTICETIQNVYCFNLIRKCKSVAFLSWFSLLWWGTYMANWMGLSGDLMFCHTITYKLCLCGPHLPVWAVFGTSGQSGSWTTVDSNIQFNCGRPRLTRSHLENDHFQTTDPPCSLNFSPAENVSDFPISGRFHQQGGRKHFFKKVNMMLKSLNQQKAGLTVQWRGDLLDRVPVWKSKEKLSIYGSDPVVVFSPTPLSLSIKFWSMF